MFKKPLSVSLLVICALIVTNGVSNASVLSVKNFSLLGSVDNIMSESKNISVGGSVFDLSIANKIQSKNYSKLSLDDISINDKVILQGIEKGGVVTISRLIDLSWSAALTNVTATSTDIATTTEITSLVATSTDVIASSTDVVASTTDVVPSTTEATSTEATSTDATSTPE